MPRRVAFTLVMLLAASAVAAEESVPALIDRLGDPEPAVRRAAYERLRALRAKATPALRAALRDARPAIADAAADLLLATSFWTAQDHPNVRKILNDYGSLGVAERAGRITRLVLERQPNFRSVVVRVLRQDPSNEVGWLALERVTPDTVWEAALDTADPATLSTPLLVLLGRVRERRGDLDAAVAVARRVLEQELDQPASTGRRLSWAYACVVDADLRAGRFDGAADWLREQIGRAEPDSDGRLPLIDQLLDVHARHGPLPGFAADLQLADAQGEPRGAFALAQVAERLGLTAAGATLLDAALARRADETDAERVVRIAATAGRLAEAGHIDSACRAWEQVAAVTTPSRRDYVTEAYLRLGQLHFEAGRPRLAGDALQRAIGHQEGLPEITRRDGSRESWSIEDEQACVYWYYLLDARARGDADAIKKQSRLLLASGSTDSGIFLDALPDVEASASGDEVDAYFTRVFDRSKARADAAPNDAVFWNDVAWLCARSGRRLSEAVGWAENAVKLAPESAYLDTLAEAQFRVGHIERAIALEKQAIAQVPRPEDGPFMRRQLERFAKAATTRPGE